MIDGTYPQNEPDLINQIKDMLMEELYENIRRNSQQQSKLNDKFQEIMKEEDVMMIDHEVNNQLNRFSLVDDKHDTSNLNYCVDLDFDLNVSLTLQ